MARLESIRILLAFAASKGFKLFQMDVKSAFLNGFIEEEVYVKQPPGFENPKFPNRVLSHPEIFGFQDVIKIKNKTIIFSFSQTFFFFTGNLVKKIGCFSKSK